MYCGGGVNLKKSKIISILVVVFCAVFTLISFGISFSLPNSSNKPQDELEQVETKSWSGTGFYGDPYLITSVADLQTLATNVNAGETYEGLYFRQTADLNLSSISNWTPIGTSSSYCFSGIYDGFNHSISNLTITDSSTTNVGLFGWLGSSDSIVVAVSNLKLINVSITEYQYVGGIAGYAKNATIENCSVTGKITGTSSSYVGGILGYQYSGVKIIRCKNSATLSVTSGRIGGIIGHMSAGSK